jgi:hypothetical protein
MTDVIPEDYYRETGYIQVTGRDLLGTVSLFEKPTPVVLNPGHMLVMQIPPERVKSLLDGTLFKQIEEAQATRSTNVTIPPGTEILVGKPKQAPTNLMNKLIEHFQSIKDVEQAWIGQILIPSSGQPAHLLVCLKLSPKSQRTFNQVWADLRSTIRSVLGATEIVDVMDANGEAKNFLERLVRFYPK